MRRSLGFFMAIFAVFLCLSAASGMAQSQISSPKKAPAGKTVNAPQATATVYVFWPKALLDPLLPDLPEWMKVRHEVIIDDKVGGRLTRGEYTAVSVPPGKHYIKIQSGDFLGSIQIFPHKGEPILISPGQSYYFIVYTDHNVAFIDRRQASFGSEQIKTLKRHGLEE